MVEWDFGEHPVSNEEIIEVENVTSKVPKRLFRICQNLFWCYPLS
ncbi:hypothetical protein AW03_024670 [Bacillus subtilis HJ5]|nr:hypothetical protein AW03_024670 [Bacillus subtilis HJ5]